MNNPAPHPAPVAQFPAVSDWLAFDKAGEVTLKSGRVELGQGITTALVQICADELDVSPECIRTIQGDTALSPAEGPTVGSLSVSIGGMSVRWAASAARHLLLSEAAGLLQTTPDTLSVEDGLIYNNGSETGMSWWSLAEKADLDQDILPLARPKARADRKLSGKELSRVDLASRLTGGAFIQDVALPGMLYGRVVQVPRPGATLAGTPETESLSPGTRIVRAGSFLGVIAPREETALRDAQTLAQRVSWEGGGPETTEDPMLTLDRDPIEVEEVMQEGPAPDAEADRITVEIKRQVLHHGSIAPSCAIGQWTDGRLTVWSHSQNVFALRQSLAKVLDLDPADVHVIHVPGAGCYGHNSADDVALDAALLARDADGAPVRTLWVREDELQCAPLSPAMKTTASATLDADGRLASMDIFVLSPPHSTRPRGAAGPNLRSAQFLPTPYPIEAGPEMAQPSGGSDRNAVPAYRVPSFHLAKGRPAALPYRASALRGLGAFLNVITIESLMDACAEEAGQTPAAFRTAHLDDPRARAVIDRVMEMSGMPDTPPDDGSGYGLGYARYKNFAGMCAVVVRIEVEEDIRVTDVWCAADAGEVVNPDGARNQIEGGIVQGLSWALKEQVEFHEGLVTSTGWEDYHILPFSEMPKIAVDLIDQSDAPPLGVGEISPGPAGAALANALRSIIGMPPRRLPLDRHELVALISG